MILFFTKEHRLPNTSFANIVERSRKIISQVTTACGYVEIPADHPVHGMDYDQVEEFYDYELPAHGGLTFASEVENAYWIGFDCAHSGDICPSYTPFNWAGDTYKTMDYVEQNIKKIIDFMEEGE